MKAASTTQSRFYGLDALRGVAAAVVLIGHAYDAVGKLFAYNAGLAVDFFFLLSGFVVAFNYLPKLASRRISVRQFVEARLTRLHPLLVLGTVIAVLLRALQALRGKGGAPFGEVLKAAGAGVLCIPTVQIGNDPHVFPLNSPQWSLFAEYVVNLVFVLSFPALNRVLGCVLAVIVGLVSLAAFVSVTRDVETGFFLNHWTFGVLRAVFPFFLGVLLALLHHRRQLPEWRLPWTLQFVLLLAVLLMPKTAFNLAFQLVAVIVIFPFIIISGRTDRLSSRQIALAREAGEMSYPIYILHRPIVGALPKLPHLSGLAFPLLLPIQLVGAVAVAFCALRWIDRPIRERLGPRKPSPDTQAARQF